MPIHDFSAMLRRGLTNLTGNEAGGVVDLGTSGLDDVQVWFLVPTDPTGTLTVTIQESTTGSGSWTDTSTPGAFAITAVGYYTRKLYATKRYLRYSAVASDNWGKVQIGICQGEAELG